MTQPKESWERKMKYRQLQLPRNLNVRLSEYCRKSEMRSKDVIRIALTQYLNREQEVLVHSLAIDPDLNRNVWDSLCVAEGDDGTIAFQLRTSKLMRAKLDAIAKANDTSRNQVINEILRFSLEDPKTMFYEWRLKNQVLDGLYQVPNYMYRKEPSSDE